MSRNGMEILLLSALMMITSVAYGDADGSVGVDGPPEGAVIGTFDSRAVAAAYYRSAEFMEMMDAQKLEHEEALMAGDSARAAVLEEMGEASQAAAHEQVFSTGDVDEIIWMIYGELPGVAEEVGVDVIVSIWDLYYMDPGEEFVDVTDQLVLFFDPSEETLELVEQIKGMPAVPMQMMDEEH